MSRREDKKLNIATVFVNLEVELQWQIVRPCVQIIENPSYQNVLLEISYFHIDIYKLKIKNILIRNNLYFNISYFLYFYIVCLYKKLTKFVIL